LRAARQQPEPLKVVIPANDFAASFWGRGIDQRVVTSSPLMLSAAQLTIPGSQRGIAVRDLRVLDL